jgi:DNA-binding NtrC family response regulator
MFDLVRKFRQKEDDPTRRTSAAQVPSNDDGSQVRLLAVTPNASDWKSLQEIAYQRGWALFWAHSCDSALSVLSHSTIPIVICDRDLPGEDWRSVLNRIAVFRPPACILLASSVSDQYLWREVVQHQGFDVLPKPFQPERLIRMVNLAWSWEGWMQRRQSDDGGGR